MTDSAAHMAFWLLEPGSGRCTGCEITVREDILIHCALCDRPFCALCICEIRLAHEVACSDCGEVP
jgi:hypothetical protein